MSGRSPTIFVSAAEASGDMHAAGLIEALRARFPDARFVGAGGCEMAAAGCEPAVEGLDLTGSATMLLGGTIRKLGYYRSAIRRLRQAVARVRPDVFVPVDSPALNWHLAAEARAAGARIVHYVCPQVWAWAPWRVKKLRRLTDAVACILPFEPDWLARHGVPARYVGHPLTDRLPPRPAEPSDILGAWASGRWAVTLLPGSRHNEIRDHVPAMIATAGEIRLRWPDARCTFAAADGLAADRILAAAGGALPEDIAVEVAQTDALLAGSHFALAVSGTVTLHAAWFGVPMVVVFRAGRLAYYTIGKCVIRTPNLSLVNILAGSRIVPELMPWFASRRELNLAVLDVMDDPGWLVETRTALWTVADTLLPPNDRTASQNAAEYVAEAGMGT
jgi:lipid-A-disaccharide synthase